MEAFSILPVKAGHQTAKAQGSSLDPRELGDVFATLLQQATLRLDARPADRVSFETRLDRNEPPRKVSAAESISAADKTDRRDDARFTDRSIDNDADPLRDPIEPAAPAEDYAEIDDDGDISVQAPEDITEPDDSAASGDRPRDSANSDSRPAEGEVAEAKDPAPAAPDATDPVPEEIAAPAALPVQAQPVAASAALAATQVLGAGGAASAALTRAATQSQVPAHAASQAKTASNTIPAAAGQFGTEVGATRVQITPASVVAQPNAALGGGAAAAALAAEAGQANAQNAAQTGGQNGGQNGAQNAGASLPNAASQIAAGATASAIQVQPGNRGNSNGLAAGSPAPASGTVTSAPGAITAQDAATGPNGNGAANAAQNAVTAVAASSASGLPGQGQGLPSSAAGGPGTPNPQNAQTPFADPNNLNAGNSGTTGGLSAAATTSEAGAQNRLAQNARTGPGGTQPAIASQTPGENGQGARPAVLDSNQNNAAQNNVSQNNSSQTGPNETSAQPGGTAPAATQAAGQNGASGTAAATEPATVPGSVQRAEGAGPANTATNASASANTNAPTAAGIPGLSQAATRVSEALPAQARPASAASLPANQVAVNIQRAVAAGQDRIRITLHPAELGQIDIKLSLSSDGAVKAIVSIERPETFELLQRDARGLEKALQDAGLKTDSNSLSFNLKGEEERNTAANREDRETGSQDDGTETSDSPELAPEIIAAANANGAGHTLDLHV